MSWWFDFVFAKLSSVRPQTRALVRVLDATAFAKDAYHFSFDYNDKTVQQSFSHALSLLPNVGFILLDGHSELDANFLIGSRPSSLQHRPRLLSVAHCAAQLPNAFFESPALQDLVYLDLSGTPGSVRSLIRPGLLRSLRVLKARGKEVDDAVLSAIATFFRLRLWSLDLSSNKISDAGIDGLLERCFPVMTLRSPAHFRVEGKLAVTDKGTAEYGPFAFIEESECSGSFTHPERYFVDSPIYLAHDGSGPQEYQAFRADGQGLPKQDSADAAIQALSAENESHFGHDFQISQGITHLELSNNLMSSFGLTKLLHKCNGRLEHLACDSLPVLSPFKASLSGWPRSASLHGILGAAHLFRPVISSNLRSLRVHHSVVTNIPTLKMDGFSSLTCACLSETSILSQIEKAFPQVFVPDMNPRLKSLTLTCIPRRSSGPLVAKLLDFLKLLSEQEATVQGAMTVASSWRSPGVLQGLRHVRLEFDPDPMEEGFSSTDDFDAEELMYGGEHSFSFFQDGFTKAPAESRQRSYSRPSLHSSASTDDKAPAESDRGHGEFLPFDVEWNGEGLSVMVWIGPAVPGPNVVVNAYRRLVLGRNLQDGVGPATPCQVLAGAPPGSYIFQTAWCAAIMPSSLEAPTASTLAGMKDVLDGLRKFRLSGKAKYADIRAKLGAARVPLGGPHYFWTGKLEVSTLKSLPHSRPSNYWR